MTNQQQSRLQEVIQGAVEVIQRFQERGGLGEQNTKASLVEPVLEALGWAIRDPDEVHREFKPTSKDNPVDYALTLLRKPRLFVEAKGLGETLTDRRWISQILGYATVAGVEWCVLTDGDEYRFYNATAPVDAEEKLFYRIKLTEVPPEKAAETLALVSRSNMEGNILNELWRVYYVDRRVKQALQELFTAPEKGLLRLIRRNVSDLSPKAIMESLRRLDVRIDSPTPVPDAVASDGQKAQKPALKGGKKRRPQKEKVKYNANLDDLIGAGLITPPLSLFRKYRGIKLEAKLLPDGKVEFNGTAHDTCSTAAEIARGTITGRRMNTNGWTFWQYLDANGKAQTLFDVRQRFLEMKGDTPGSG